MGTITPLSSTPSDYIVLTTDYVGNMIYENGALKEILLPEGYYQNGTFYYYLKDHLGDNRVTINSSGTVVEKSHYYPSGTRFFTESTNNDLKPLPYRYNGKELEAMNGLNQMDYGARRRFAGLPVWTGVDPLAEKYYSISPYVYCAGNPIRFIDPNGKEVVAMDENAKRNIKNTLTKSEAKYVKFNKDGTLNTDKLNKSKSMSENMKALKAEANSDVKYKYAVTDKDHSGRSFSEESGKMYRGVTEMPGAENNASPDKDVWVLTSSLASEKLQAKNTAHEGFGHGYIYEQTRDVDKASHRSRTATNVYSPTLNFGTKMQGDYIQSYSYPMFDYETITINGNLLLQTQINNVQNETENNYESNH